MLNESYENRVRQLQDEIDDLEAEGAQARRDAELGDGTGVESSFGAAVIVQFMNGFFSCGGTLGGSRARPGGSNPGWMTKRRRSSHSSKRG